MDKIEIYGISISICAVFVSILINSSYAQSVDDFKTYTNNDLNFTIQHPSNWEIDDEEDPTKHLVEDNLAGSTSLKTVSFYAPSDHPEADNIPRKYLSEPTFKITIHKVLPYLDTDTMALKNTTLQQSVQKWLDFYSSLDTPYKLIRQNEVTVGGNTGEKIEYTLGIYYDSVVFAVSNGKLYTLAYKDDPLKVPETLPLANKMVESFQIK